MVEETGELWAPPQVRTWRPVQVHQDRMAPGCGRPVGRGVASLSCAIVEALRAGRTSIENTATFEDGYRVHLFWTLHALRTTAEAGQRSLRSLRVPEVWSPRVWSPESGVLESGSGVWSRESGVRSRSPETEEVLESWSLEVLKSRLQTRDSRLATRDSRLQTSGLQDFKTPRLQDLDSRLQD